MRKVYNTNNLTVTGAANMNVVTTKQLEGSLRVADFAGPITATHVDTLNVEEIRPSSGKVAVSGGNLCMGNERVISTDNIDSYNGMYISMSAGMNVDHIRGRSGNGVTIDSALIQNGNMYTTGTDTVEITSNKNVPFGYLGLNGSGKIASCQSLSSGVFAFTGYWDPSTSPIGGTPNLNDTDLRVNGNMYIVSADGNNSIGNGQESFVAGNSLVYLSEQNKWVQFANANRVVSMNGKTGNVSLTSDDIPQTGTNLYFTDSLICGNGHVKAAKNHRMIVSGNPHNNTASDVGNTVAQWNANKLQGKPIAAVIANDGDVLQYTGGWTPVARPIGGGVGAQLMLSACKIASNEPLEFSGAGVFSFNGWDAMLNSVSFDSTNGSWIFPTSGTYRIQWGASYNYVFGTTVTADARIVIDGSVVSRAPVCLTFSDRKTCSGSWVGEVNALSIGSIKCSQSSSGPAGNFVDNYWIIVEKW